MSGIPDKNRVIVRPVAAILKEKVSGKGVRFFASLKFYAFYNKNTTGIFDLARYEQAV